MTNLGRVRGSARPTIEFTATKVFVPSNIVEYQEDDGITSNNGFEYDLMEYTKDEYILQNLNEINELKDELAAAKIILGVE